MMLATHEKHARTKLIATFVTVLVIAGVVLVADHLKSKTSSAASMTPTNTAVTTPPNAATSTPSAATTPGGGTYKDGSYTAMSDYSVPHGDENIQVSLTLQNGVITNASIQNSEYDHTSAEFQEEFAAEYKPYVVGKKVSGLHINLLAGASDTTQAFNDAVSQIANKAQS